MASLANLKVYHGSWARSGTPSTPHTSIHYIQPAQLVNELLGPDGKPLLKVWGTGHTAKKIGYLRER